MKTLDKPTTEQLLTGKVSVNKASSPVFSITNDAYDKCLAVCANPFLSEEQNEAISEKMAKAYNMHDDFIAMLKLNHTILLSVYSNETNPKR